MSQLFLFHDGNDNDTASDETEDAVLGDADEETDNKVCRICKVSKSLDDFFLDRGKAYSKCKDCFGQYQKSLRIAKKSAPEKPAKCECCGKIPDKWVCDHYPNTDIFRGWVCSDCNLAAGYMGDTHAGAIMLFNYLYSRREGV